MSSFYGGAAAFLFLTIIAGLWRVLRGPDPADRLMVVQLSGTTGAAIMLLLAEAQGPPGLRYLALVFASLSVVTVVAFVRLTWTDEPAEERP
jgi:multicomponent Na+:H+ antiporter subunit F